MLFNQCPSIYEINKDSKILQYFYIKHQYLIIHHYLYQKIFLDIKKCKNSKSVDLAGIKIYNITKELSNALYRLEDYMTINNEVNYEDASKLELFLQEELSNPEYYIIETLNEKKDVSKDDILDLKRFTFKNFQDIIERIESNNTNETLIEEMESVTKNLQKEMAEGAVEIYNLIFEIGRSIEGDSNNTLIPVVQTSLEKAKQILENLGVEEIPTYGKEIDGKYMVSLGTVSNKENENMPQDHVAVMYRKAFRIKDTKKVIQTALVKTIE